MASAFIHVSGNLGQDPEVRKLGDREVCSISVAVNGREKVDNEWVDKTTWFRCSIWAPHTIDFVDKFLRKGDKVDLGGVFSQRIWRDREGYDQTSNEVNVTYVNGPPPPAGSGGRGGDDRGRGGDRGGDRGRGGDDRGGRAGSDRASRDSGDRARSADTRGGDRGRSGDDRGRSRGGEDRGGRPSAGAGWDAPRGGDLDDEIPF